MLSEEKSQFFLFKDCIARHVLVTSNENDPADSSLDDFTTYLATESWPSLPNAIHEATYETRSNVPNVDSISLDSISTDFIDTLVAYRVAASAEEAVTFLRKALVDYIDEACAPPPVWKSTRTTECEICYREIPLTYHHLIPRSVHAKVLKQKWHPESMINSVAWLCRPCHSAVHKIASNENLARYFHTIDLLLEREDIQRWQKYAMKQRYGVRRG